MIAVTGWRVGLRARNGVGFRVRSGLTNREIADQLFLSPKTIENRLGRIYAKLGIAGRDELKNVPGLEA